jgi:hypothetical protein
VSGTVDEEPIMLLAERLQVGETEFTASNDVARRMVPRLENSSM